MRRAVGWSVPGVLALILLFGCAEQPESFTRSQVGLVPEGFDQRQVASAEDAKQQVRRYLEALGLRGLSVERVRPLGGRYLVYVSEDATGRGAFGLQISQGGQIEPKQFPGMAPEMMWNQKYGHRARPRTDAIELRLDPEQARVKAARVLEDAAELTLGTPTAYYGYYLFPLSEGEKVRGEAAVNAEDGAVVWKLYPPAPGSEE